MRRLVVAGLAVAATLAVPAAALAEPPSNDAPGAAAEFTEVQAGNDQPDERQGIAELREATADAGVPRCLGAGSFERTVWFRIAAADAAREIQVEASGRTTDVVDLAAFVQPPAGANTSEPNACGGTGAGGAAASEEPTSGVVLRVPGGRAVLVQAGRRGTAGSPDDERAILSLSARDLPPGPSPVADQADAQTPAIPLGAAQAVALGGATTTEEDPAQPACPSFGGVWRRHVPDRTGALTVTASDAQAAALTVFAGQRPTAEDVLGCVDRERSAGDLALSFTARRGVPLWIRVGTDRPPPDATTTLRVTRGATAASGVCDPGGGFRSVGARRLSGGRLRLAFQRAVPRPVTVDVFQQSVGRRVVGERLVARFTRRARTFTWSGRATRRGRRVTDGFYFARFRVAAPGGGTDVRRVTLRRVRGRFTVRPRFHRRGGCDLVRSFKLTRPVFGGPGNRAVQVSYRLTRRARVRVELLRGRRVVRRLARRTGRPGRTYRVRVRGRGLRRGDYRFRITATSGVRTVVATLTSRRL